MIRKKLETDQVIKPNYNFDCKQSTRGASTLASHDKLCTSLTSI